MQIITRATEYIDPSRKIPMIPPYVPDVRVSILAETEDYNHKLMNIPHMWKSTRGAGVKVVVLDTGLPKHVDLAPSGGKSFTGDGYLFDENGHNTHVAGIIAAIAHNGMGVRGIAPDCDDYHGAVLGADGSGSVNSIIAGIRWAVDEIGAGVINMSLGIPASASRIRSLEQACDYAVSQGVAVVAAAGNESGKVGQPAVFDSVIAVAAVDRNMRHANFSNVGGEVDFAAGGVNVFSTSLNNTYARMSGTSMSAPALSGVAALILSDALNGNSPRKLTPSELVDKLKKISYDVGSNGFDAMTGNGIPVFASTGDTAPPVVGDSTWRRILAWLRRFPFITAAI